MTLTADSTMFPGGSRDDGLPAALSDPVWLAAARATGLVDTDKEQVFDDLARLAAVITKCGRAFITLVDEHQSFWKSCVGLDLDAENVGARQHPVRESFCYFQIGLAGERFVVEDAAADPPSRNPPSVGPMRIGAWTGYPILAPGGDRPEFGENGLARALDRCGKTDPAAIVAHLAEVVDQHSQGRVDDDIALRVPNPAATCIE